MPRYSDNHRAQMVAAYQRGDSYPTIAHQFRCSHNTVRAAVLATGIPPRPRGAQRRLTGYGTWSRRRATNGYMVWSAWDSRTQRNGFLLEHRLIMSWVLGRELRSGENVHHIDGDRANNDPSNLELWATSQPSGVRVSQQLGRP